MDSIYTFFKAGSLPKRLRKFYMISLINLSPLPHQIEHGKVLQEMPNFSKQLRKQMFFHFTWSAKDRDRRQSGLSCHLVIINTRKTIEGISKD